MNEDNTGEKQVFAHVPSFILLPKNLQNHFLIFMLVNVKSIGTIKTYLIWMFLIAW